MCPHHDLLTAHRALCSHTEPSLLSLNVSHRSALSLTVLRASVTTDAVIALRHYYRKVRWVILKMTLQYIYCESQQSRNICHRLIHNKVSQAEDYKATYWENYITISQYIQYKLWEESKKKWKSIWMKTTVITFFSQMPEWFINQQKKSFSSDTYII